MKTLNMLFLSLLFTGLFAQEKLEKQIKTEVKEVTVFLEGAQITRSKLVDLNKGESLVKFVNLSPFIDAKSVQVKAEGNITVLSVNHQQNYLNKSEKSTELNALEDKLQLINEDINLEETYLNIIKEEIGFLQTNKQITGSNVQVSVANLQEASTFYSERLTSLKMGEIKRNKTLKLLYEKRSDVQNQIRTLTNKKDYPTGEVLVKVDAKQSANYSLELSYMVSNAGWFPSYDIRAKNINEPVQLIYKANVKQDTKVDWNNVKLKFSSADPNVSGIAPELKTYYLSYNTLPSSYKSPINLVRGKVLFEDGEPIPGASVMVEGTTIGTVTDMDGNYMLSIPNNASQLSFSFIGCVSQVVPINEEIINVTMQEELMALDEVVVTGYGSGRNPIKALQGKVAGVTGASSTIKIRGASSIAVPTAQVENQTTFDFEINTPYTIKSDNKSYTVDMEYYNLPAFYQYYCVPKIDKDAFLIANIVDWEKYNLLEGEANLFFEETYVGKTILDVRYASDTLEISLGRDKKVSVNREKIKEYTDKKLIGNKKEETRAWSITVKNNKNQAINMIVLDQVPVSTFDDIEVNVHEISGAKYDKETGELKWEFELNSNEESDFKLKYSVKFPKYRNLIVE